MSDPSEGVAYGKVECHRAGRPKMSFSLAVPQAPGYIPIVISALDRWDLNPGNVGWAIAQRR